MVDRQSFLLHNIFAYSITRSNMASVSQRRSKLVPVAAADYPDGAVTLSHIVQPSVTIVQAPGLEERIKQYIKEEVDKAKIKMEIAMTLLVRDLVAKEWGEAVDYGFQKLEIDPSHVHYPTRVNTPDSEVHSAPHTPGLDQ